MTTDPLAPLNLGAPYHIGIVVRDLEAGMQTYGAAFGISEWRVREAADLRYPALWHGRPHSGMGYRFAFAVSELPFIELLQPTTDVDWTPNEFLREHGEGVYHLGYWVEDVRATLAQATVLGLEAELVAIDDGDPPRGGIAYLKPPGTHLRIELVASVNRERTLHLIRTGEDL